MADRITGGQERLNPLFNRPSGRAEKVSFDFLNRNVGPLFSTGSSRRLGHRRRDPAIASRAARVSKVQRHGSSVLYAA
jgi:hypothetical protein